MTAPSKNLLPQGCLMNKKLVLTLSLFTLPVTMLAMEHQIKPNQKEIDKGLQLQREAEEHKRKSQHGRRRNHHRKKADRLDKKAEGKFRIAARTRSTGKAHLATLIKDVRQQEQLLLSALNCYKDESESVKAQTIIMDLAALYSGRQGEAQEKLDKVNRRLSDENVSEKEKFEKHKTRYTNRLADLATRIKALAAIKQEFKIIAQENDATNLGGNAPELQSPRAKPVKDADLIAALRAEGAYEVCSAIVDFLTERREKRKAQRLAQEARIAEKADEGHA